MIKVIKLPFQFLHIDWRVGDIWRKIGTAHELGYWSYEEDQNDDMFKNERTGEILNSILFYEKGKEYFNFDEYETNTN